MKNYGISITEEPFVKNVILKFIKHKNMLMRYTKSKDSMLGRFIEMGVI